MVRTYRALYRPSIERVHILFIKSRLSVKVYTQTDFVYYELGRLYVYSYAIINVIKYCVKVINSSENKNMNIMYKKLLHEIARYPNKQNWASQVKDIWTELNFEDVWTNQKVHNYSSFIQDIKDRVKFNACICLLNTTDVFYC